MRSSKKNHPNWSIPFARILLMGCLLVALLPQAARAQSESGQGSALLYDVTVGDFPEINGFLDLYDGQGQFVRGLSPATFSLLEDGKTIRPSRVNLREIPLQVVVAINASSSLAVRDGQGLSRYDKAAIALAEWAASRPADSGDNISLTWNGGIVASRVTPLTWRNRLEIFDPQLRTSTSDLSALAFALDAALDMPVPPGGKRAILLLSDHLDNQSAAGLNDLTTRANLAGVRIFVWILDSADFFDHSGTQALRQMAAATGGRTFDFSGVETLPDPESWFDNLRWGYTFSYNSLVRNSGQYSLSGLASIDELSLTTNSVSLALKVEAPNPILLAPPAEIVRQNAEDPFNLEASQPAQQQLEILVEFPDGNPRPLTRAALYVDDELAQENTEPPFELFTWNLRPYLVSGKHTLRVEITDSLGLSSASVITPVDVVVVQPPGGIFGIFLRNRVALVTSAIILAGFVLLLALFFGGQKTFTRLAERRRIRARQLDPVTQPLKAENEPPSGPKSARNPFPWLRRKAPAPPAYLVRLTSDLQPIPGSDPIALSAPEMTFGADPTQATNVLGDACIAPLHARLQRTGEQFLILDNNAVAGTWVNYEPIPQEGQALAHGDVVNFGRLTYRFVLGKPPAPQKPTLTPLSRT
jgi:hypothetical protein